MRAGAGFLNFLPAVELPPIASAPLNTIGQGSSALRLGKLAFVPSGYRQAQRRAVAAVREVKQRTRGST